MENKEAVFRQVYQQVGDKLYRLCLGYTGNEDDAKDLMQEILLLVWTHLDQFRGESAIHTWIFRIATNKALLYIQRRDRVNQVQSSLENSVVDQALRGATQEDAGNPEARVQALYRAVSMLPQIDRIVVGLLLEGCSYQEIASITGFSISNVGVKINRIKKVLSTLIQ